MTGEEQRLVRVLLERAWPQIDLMGTIAFFGLAEETTPGVRQMSDGLEHLCQRVGFDKPPPSMGRGTLRPRRT